MRAYKRLSAVERAFRSLKTVDLKVRPVFHRTADRVRAHVFLCMLAYYARNKRTADGWPAHSFRTLLGDLATIARNRVVPRVPGAKPFEVLTRPTTLQREAFELLGVRP